MEKLKVRNMLIFTLCYKYGYVDIVITVFQKTLFFKKVQTAMMSIDLFSLITIMCFDEQDQDLLQ